jgi:hypothetical protein
MVLSLHLLKVGTHEVCPERNRFLVAKGFFWLNGVEVHPATLTTLGLVGVGATN